MPEIHYSSSSFSYKGKDILSGLTFSILKGQHCGIVGPIGSGKTMLLRSLTGVLPFKDGVRKFIVDGNELTPYEFSCITGLVEFSEQNKYFKPRTHFYQQRYQSLEDDESRSLLVGDYLKLRGLSIKENKVASILDRAKVTELFDRKLIHISSGQRKRLQLSIAIAKSPKVLLLDCPYTGVDKPTKDEINIWLEEVAQQQGIQFIIAANENDLPSFIESRVKLNGRGLLDKSASERALGVLINKWENSNEVHFDSMIRMKGVKLGYGNVQILKSVNWQVNQSELVGLQGQNGSGKSSLLSLIYGDNPLAYNKEIYLFDKKRGTGESIWDIKRNTGFVSSEFHLYMGDNITCEKLIATGYFDQLFIPRKLTDEEYEIIDLYLSYFHVQGLKDRLFSQISFGEQRLVLLIRALVKNPPLLLLDEPYHGFDSTTIDMANGLLAKMTECSDNTLVFISHDKVVMPEILEKHYELSHGTISVLN